MRDPGVPKPRFAYHHIQKTGGTSMRTVLFHLFGRENVFWHGETGDFHKVLETQGPDAFDSYTLIGGHLPFGVMHKLATPRIILAMTRDPYAQIVSHFEYVSQRPKNLLYTEGSLFDELAAGGRFTKFSTNVQCRLLSGRPIAQATLHTLRHRPAIVGTLPRCEDFLDRVSSLLGQPAPRLPTINTGHAGYAARHEHPDLRALIDAISTEDRKLFDAIEKAGGTLDTVGGGVGRAPVSCEPSPERFARP